MRHAVIVVGLALCACSKTSDKPTPTESSGSSAGVTASCTPDHRNTDGVIAIDVDGKVTGDAGEVTVKGHLDVVCRSGR